MGQTNPFVQFAGHYQSVVGEISRRLAERGGNIVEIIGQLAQPANSSVLDEVVAVLAKLAGVFQVKIGGSRASAEVLQVSGYTSYDRSIAERCVLAAGRERVVNIEVFGIEHFDHDPTDEEIEAEYAQRGLKRPTPDHAIRFGEQHKHLPVEDRPIIFYLQNPIPGADGGRSVLGLWRDGVKRGLVWSWLSPRYRWFRDYLFAGVRE